MSFEEEMVNEGFIEEPVEEIVEDFGWSDIQSVDTELIENHKKIIEKKKEDPGFHRLKMHINGSKKPSWVEMYETRFRGRIRNAVSGLYEPYMMGLLEEDLFYKVTLSTGSFNNKDPVFLFYDTPEQFEKHFYTSISQEDKEVWYKKNLRFKLMKMSEKYIEEKIE